MANLAVTIENEDLDKIYKAVQAFLAKYPKSSNYDFGVYLSYISNCGQRIKYTAAYMTTSVPSQCGMISLHSTYTTGGNHPSIYSYLKEAKRFSVAAQGEELRADLAALLEDLLPCAERLLKIPKNAVPEDSVKKLALELQGTIRTNYNRVNQFILTDNVGMAACFREQNGSNHISLRPSHLVDYLGGVVIKGPLTPNHNHPDSGYIQTYIWIPPWGTIVQEDEDPTYGVRIRTGDTNVYEGKNAYSSRAYFDSQLGNKVTLVNEVKKEVLDNGKKEKFPKIKKKRGEPDVEELRPEVH